MPPNTNLRLVVRNKTKNLKDDKTTNFASSEDKPSIWGPGLLLGLEDGELAFEF